MTSLVATRLVDASIPLAALVAATLALGRDRVIGATGWEKLANKRIKTLLARCEATLDADIPLGPRLLAMLKSTWRRGDPRRRPDVLDVTARLLASPERPESLNVARFAVILALRALYGVRHEAEALRLLRASHDELRRRYQQHARRERRPNANGPNVEQLTLDVLGMGGHVRRSMSLAARREYYAAFERFPLGVDPRTRARIVGTEQAQLKGDASDFPTLVNLLFAQPTCIPGLDAVLGGMLPTLREDGVGKGGGQVTLVAGPAGSGKTTFCLAVAARAAELGARVRYVATEEAEASLRAKLTATGGMAFPDIPTSTSVLDFDFVDGKVFDSLDELHGVLRGELRGQNKLTTNSDDAVAYLPFPTTVVVDSLSVLLEGQTSQEAGRPPDRKNVAIVLASLRELGVSVWLVGGEQEARDIGLEYLVDNVLVLGTDGTRSDRHPLRTLTVEKTRLQTAHRGRHVLHLSRSEGVVVSPSLHAVIRDLHDDRRDDAASHDRMALDTSGPATGPAILPMRAESQILVHGRGSAGKARFGLALAIEPRLDGSTRADTALAAARAQASLDARVLVVSFLYPESYYLKTFNDACGARFGSPMPPTEQVCTTLCFYPGFVDPETVVAKVGRTLERARLEGRPFTALLLDGVHNVLLQFPLLETERLLWPTLSRLASHHHLRVVTTFTFFEADVSQRRDDGAPTMVDGLRQIFFHLLVSSADYSFLVERPSDAIGHSRDHVEVELVATLDGFGRRSTKFWWDPRRFAPVSPIAKARRPRS